MTRPDIMAFKKFAAANKDDPEYAGRYVVFVHGILQAVGDSEIELVRRMYKQFGNVDMHVGRVSEYNRIVCINSPELVQTHGALDRESLIRQIRVIADYMEKMGGSGGGPGHARAAELTRAADTLEEDPMAARWFQDVEEATPEPHELSVFPCHVCGNDARELGRIPVQRDEAGYVCASCRRRKVMDGDGHPERGEAKA